MLRDFPLTSRIATHAAAFAAAYGTDTVTEPAAPRTAATVVLLRDAPGGPEVFVMRRTSSMAFAAQMHVFPGGGVDPRDLEASVAGGGAGGRIPWRGPSPEQLAQRTGVGPAETTGLVCAAVRELFEECGVLLAAAPGEDVVADLSDPSWERDRLALLDRSLALSQLLEQRGLELRADLLAPWAHWCTPVFEPRRYDTWFFVAQLPAGQRAREVGGEADHATWLPAVDAAAGGNDGTLAMMPPTVVTVEEVASAPDVATLMARPRRLRLLMPWLVRSPSGLAIRLDLDGSGGGEPGPPGGIEEIA